jgi:predicted phage baseplate assembly protein
MAAQTITRRNEVLRIERRFEESKFRAAVPDSPGQQLEVREAELPAATERDALEAEEGADAVTTVFDARGRSTDVFVRWHEVPDFYASGPRDRHYVLDRFTGQVRFGDGVNGLVPPIGIGSVRLSRYRIGGGQAGNRPPGAIVQLKTTVPYVDKVTNHEPATGGADAEPIERLVERAPRDVRHGGRAVTIEDYEDLAQLASPAVARAKCVPLSDLVADVLDPSPKTSGEVSVIVVPRSSDAKPLPSVELLRTVQDSLDDRPRADGTRQRRRSVTCESMSSPTSASSRSIASRTSRPTSSSGSLPFCIR